MMTERLASKSAASLSDGGALIGVALVVLMPGYTNWLSTLLFERVLESRLSAKGFEVSDTGVSFGSHFIIWTMAASNRNLTLRAIEVVLKEMGLWELCEVAFFDEAEGFWRTVQPSGAPPFDRLLSECNVEAEKQQLALEMEFLLAIQDACKRSIERDQRGAE